MARSLHFNSRTSGRDLLAVRRPSRPVRLVVAPALPAKVETLKKDELVALAGAAGVDTSGKKAEIADRLAAKPEAQKPDDPADAPRVSATAKGGVKVTGGG